MLRKPQASLSTADNSSCCSCASAQVVPSPGDSGKTSHTAPAAAITATAVPAVAAPAPAAAATAALATAATAPAEPVAPMHPKAGAAGVKRGRAKADVGTLEASRDAQHEAPAAAGPAAPHTHRPRTYTTEEQALMQALDLTELLNIVRNPLRPGATSWTVRLYRGLSQNRNLFGKLFGVVAPCFSHTLPTVCTAVWCQAFEENHGGCLHCWPAWSAQPSHLLTSLSLIQVVGCCPSVWPLFVAVGTYTSLRTAVRERDLAVLAMYDRQEANLGAPATLLPAKRYSQSYVKAAAAELHQMVSGAWAQIGHYDLAIAVCGMLARL
mgnify:CR=1 FL=1